MKYGIIKSGAAPLFDLVREGQGVSLENNYVDIMFEDWNVGGICQCPFPNGQLFQSEVHFNYFGKLANEGHCTNWQYVEDRIDFCRILSSPHPINAPNIQERCHILDFSPYWGISASIPIGGYQHNYCPKSYQLTSDPGNHPLPFGHPDREPNATYGNTYFEDINPPCNCICKPPHNLFK